MSKALPYETLMALSEDQLAELYPNGAVEAAGKWKPAEGKADRTLKRLLKDKAKRVEKPIYVRRGYSRSNYTRIKGEALGVDKHGRGAPEEAIPTSREEYRRMSEDARARLRSVKAEDQWRKEIRSCMESIRQLAISQVKMGRDPKALLDRLRAAAEEDDRKAA